ncbi:MAG TPA: hypothetical protein VGM88_24405 [Kofleriaceae bacterium]
MIALAGCGGSAASDCSAVDPATMTFIAFAGCFDDFRDWTSFHDDLEDPSLDAAVNGPRTQYINNPPPHGATEFPIGTIIAEARESGTMPIFFGIKRGGGFNNTGAVNWEWGEITENPVTIVWRGYGPPTGDSYGGDVNTCNDCHKACGSSNDYVCSPFLQLSSF